MAIGWIKLHRQIQDCDFLWDSKDEPFDRRSAWIDLLLMANHKDTRLIFRGKAITVGCGQRITSLHKLSERWHWGINRVRNYLDLLQDENMIIRESDNTKTLITIVNYQKYQGFDEFDHTPTDTVTDTVTDTLTDTVTDIAQIQSQIQSQIPNNNDNNDLKNDKNDKNDKKHIYGAYHHVRLKESEIDTLRQDLGEYMTDECITYLDEYIEMKGYKAKSHYLCIKKWVVDAVKEKNKKKPMTDEEKTQAYLKAWEDA